FKTTDGLPGQVELANDGYITHLDGGGAFPGLRITPINTSEMEYPAGIGPTGRGLTTYGGQAKAGGSSIVQCHPEAAFMRTYHEGGGTAGVVQVSPRASLMRTYREDGGLAGEVQTSPSASFMRTTHEDGVRRGAMETAPDYSQMLTYAEDGVSRGILYTNPSKAEIRVVGPDGSNRSRITANDNRITLFAAQNGQRYLEINETGIWIRTGPSSRQKSYNL